MSWITFILEKSKFIGLLILLGIGAQLFLSRPRWQYYPLYLAAALYFILVALNYFNAFEITSRNSKWMIGIGLFLISTSLLLLLIFPKEKLPIPSGPFEVGTRIYDLEDKTRDEIYTETQNDHRKIKYQIWYPTDETEGFKKAKWIADGKILTRQLAQSFHLPSFMLDHTVEIDANSYVDAPVSAVQKSYPVVVISHGWQGFRELHTDFAEELASQGFIAVSIDHTYGSQAVKFEDGSVAYLNKEALPSESDPVKFGNASTLLVTTYGEDVATVLDDLEKQNATEGDFKGRLDLEALGLLGHSTGGGGSVSIALKDNRIKALLGLDAWVKPIGSDILKQGLEIPALFIRSEQWSIGPNNVALEMLRKNSEDATLIQMNRTAHVDFSMSYMFSPLMKYIGFSGEMGGRKSSEIQKELILDFFDYHLRNPDDDAANDLKEITDKYEDLLLID